MTDEPITTTAGGPDVEQPADEQPAHRAVDVAPASLDPLDLDRVERDLAGVEAALRRLDEGTYWTDEVTGEPIADDLLAADPVARRAR